MYKIFIILFISLFHEGPGKLDILIPPLDIPLVLSANFGELRTGHFHSGVDFKTEGTTGKKVYAVADGYIYRIVVGPSGFGKALYIRHTNGLSTVYGHLDKFSPEIEDFVKESQYHRESFSVSLFPEPDKFRIKQGEIIALSGNSGSSLGPHLHFEVRKSKNEMPVNPIQYYTIEDDIKPVIKNIAIYPASPLTTINDKNEKLILSTSGNKGNYKINLKQSIEVSGPIGFGINTYDFLNNSWNKCGVRIINMQLDDKLIYCHSIDEFAFSETRYINSHIDYEERLKSKIYFQKTFIDPNNRLSIYNHIINKGIINPEKEGNHQVKISVSDFNNNCSIIEFEFYFKPANHNTKQSDNSARLMPYGDINSFNHHDIKLNFPKDCFYDTVFFKYMKAPSDISGLFSDIHYVHNRYTPVHKSFNIAIKALNVPDSIQTDKLCLVYMPDNDTKEYFFAGGEWDDGFIKAKSSDFGIYAIGIDTVSPEIIPLRMTDGKLIADNTALRFKLSDDFSGINTYEGYIDGNWALFEWNPKSSTLLYYPDPDHIKKGKQHKLKLAVTDNRNNTSKLDFSFFW